MNSKRGATVALFLAIAGPAVSAEKRVVTPADVIALRQVSEPTPSPDGTRVAFVVAEIDEKENLYQSDVWIAGVGGDPYRVTRHPKNDKAPAWSPDGKNLAFLSEREEKAQIFLVDARGGEPWKLTDAKAGVAAFCWSPDAKAIAYVATDAPTDEEEKKTKAKNDEKVVDKDPKMAHLWTIDLDTKKATRLTEGGFTLADPQWSPDGSAIAAVRRPTPRADDDQLSDVVIVPRAGGPLRVLFANDGPDTAPRWSPDGKSIALLTREGKRPQPGYSSLAVVAAAGGTLRLLTGDDLNPSAPVWSADGQRLWFTAAKGVRGVVFSVPAAGGPAKAEIEGPFVASSLAVAHPSGALAFLRQDPQSPPDAWLLRPATVKTAASGSGPVQMSHANPQVKDFVLGTTEAIRWKSTDGREIEGILHLPAGYTKDKPLPLLVEAHGGPAGAVALSFPATWASCAHCYTGKGWAVLQPNFRGSVSYGDAFERENVKDWGKGDYQDIQSGVDDLVKRGVADSGRLAFRGWSYGGYMTAWTITQTTRFKAAACGAGLTNLYSMYSTNDLQRALVDYFGAEPWNATDLYWQSSAMAHIKDAKTPTLILHGERDDRVPLSQSQELYMGLKQNGVPVEMVVYPREPHGLREPAHQKDKLEREMAWFARYVLGTP
jgi:dipeptidyl aminopeptidase/acylaminoacyl peptidase